MEEKNYNLNMDYESASQDFSLDDILNEFLDAPEPEAVEPDEELETLMNLPEVSVPEVPAAVEEPEEAGEEAIPAPMLGDTNRMEQIIKEALKKMMKG